MHCPVAGLVWHREILTGTNTFPVSADAVIFPLSPTFIVATAKAPTPFVPEMFAIPSFLGVATKATMSGTGAAEAESRSVLSPVLMGAGLLSLQLKLKIGRASCR